MTGCVVCNLDEGYCEFCRGRSVDQLREEAQSRLNYWVNRDPGDESDRIPFDVDHPGPRNTPAGRVEVTARSYKATYRLGDNFRTRTMIGFDSFQDTAYLAIRERREGETLVGLTELT